MQLCLNTKYKYIKNIRTLILLRDFECQIMLKN